MDIEKIIEKIFSPDLTKRFQEANDKAIGIVMYPIVKLYEYFSKPKEKLNKS